MSLQDPIADCLTRMRNGLMRGKKVVHAPFSKFKHELVSLLVKEGYINSCEKIKVDGKDALSISLRYINEAPCNQRNQAYFQAKFKKIFIPNRPNRSKKWPWHVCHLY